MRSTAQQRNLEELLIKQNLHELCVDYTHAVDRCDGAALRDLFCPDGVIDSGALRGNPEFFAREFVNWVHRFAKVTFHAVTNERFHISGSEATGESYVVAVARIRSDSGAGHSTERDVLSVGRYLDRFQKREGVWRFLERRFVLDHEVECSPDHRRQ